MLLFSHKITFWKPTGPTIEIDWWQMIYLKAIFAICVSTISAVSTLSILPTAPCQYCS